ncbi:MAG: NTP transferase domain-containing protein [Opitutae bacterium]|nr:NTP transferase domain-containing protein [Opitutae bacterium]
MKAVLPAAGFGTRFLPLAKAIPKEMLPLGDKPVIHYVVAEAVAAGFDDILIILSRGKEAIPTYFTPNPDLERHLEQIGKTRELAALRELSRLGRIHYTYQPAMRGLGDAVRQAKEFVGNDPVFAVLLADTVMHGGSPLPAMLAAWRQHAQPSVALEPCPAEKVSRYGVAGGRQLEPDVFALAQLVEKPKPEVAPRLLDAAGATLPYHAFAARYLFTPEIFDCLDTTAAGYGGEVQVTDAMEQLRTRRGFLGVRWPGRRLDIGHPAGLIEAARLLGEA